VGRSSSCRLVRPGDRFESRGDAAADERLGCGDRVKLDVEGVVLVAVVVDEALEGFFGGIGRW
jgi:hypothetical protein